VKLLVNIMLGCLFAISALAESIKLSDANTVMLRGEINGQSVTAAQVDLFLKVLKRGDATYPIFIVLDTPGGSVYAGGTFIDYCRTLKNVHTITLFAASMGSAIVQGCGGERLITASGIHMYHRAAGGFEGQFETGEVESRLAFWKSVVRAMEVANATRLSMSLDDYKAKVLNEWWMLGEAAVAVKSADRVVNISCDDELTKTINSETVEVLIYTFKVKRSGCPLFRFPIGVSQAEDDAGNYIKKLKSTYPYYNL